MVFPAQSIRTRLSLLVGVFCLFVGSSSLQAAPFDGGLDDSGGTPDFIDVAVSAVLSHESAAPGQTVWAAITYRVPASAHIQVNDFFYAELGDGLGATIGAGKMPETIQFHEEPVYVGDAVAFYPVTIAKDAAAGPATLKINAGYQACLEEPVFVCYAPGEETLEFAVQVVDSESRPNPTYAAIFAKATSAGGDSGGTSASGSGDSPDDGWMESAPASGGSDGLAGKLEQALLKGSFAAFALVFVGGFLTSFTPCVYPMIPITISYIGGSSKSKAGGFILSLFFVLGIALMYSVLGLLAATTGSLFGNAMTSTPVLVGVSVVFFAMGASMLGAFDLAIPSGLQGKLQSGPRGGVVGAIFMGMVTGIVASPCVGPVLVVLLTWVAQHGTPLYGFFLLFTFACGLGLLFIIIGTFAGALNALPQAGQWMDTVKHVFGVILFAMGIYYARTLLGPDVTRMATGLLVLMTGTFYGAFRPISEGAEHGVLLRKGLGIAMVLCGSFMLLVGLAGYSGVQLAAAGGAGGASGSAAHPGLDWVMSDEEGLATARAESRPVVMDFYADWCTACKELDHKTWVDPAVQAEADRFVAIKFDFTENTDWAKAKKAEYGVAGLPTVIFFDSAGNEVERFFGFRDAEGVLQSMQAVR